MPQSSGNRSAFEGASHPLMVRVRTVGRVAWVLVVLRSLAITLAALLLLALFVGAVDWGFRWQTQVVRWAATILLIASAGLLVWSRVLPSLRARFSMVNVAIRIERVFPSLGDRLSSSVAFLDSDGALAQQAELCHATVNETAEACEKINVASAIDPWPTLRASAGAMVMIVVLVGLVVQRPAETRLAAARLAQPWNRLQWPQVNHLRIDTLLESVHEGEAIEVMIEDAAGDLPSDTVLLVRTATEVREFVPRQAGRGGVVDLLNVAKSFSIRAVGGDDDSMDWMDVEVVAAPAVQRHEWSLVSPAYMSLAPREIEAQRFEVNAGTKGSLRLEASKPITEAKLEIVARDRETPPSVTHGMIEADGRVIQFEGILFDASVDCRILWRDEDGIEGKPADSWSIKVVDDMIPRIAWSGTPPGMITASGIVSVAWQAEDDFGIAETGVTLEVISPDGARVSELPSEDFEGEGRNVSGRAEIPFAKRKVREGDRVELVAWAMDSKGQRGESTAITISIVSPNDIQAAIASTEKTILEQLRTVTALQRASRDQSLGAASELNAGGARQDAAARFADAAESIQANAQENVDGENGLIAEVAKALELLNASGLDALEKRDFERLLERMRSLSGGQLAGLVSDVSRVSELLAGGPLDDSQLASASDSMKEIAAQQGNVADELDRLASSLATRDAVRDLTRQLSQVDADQKQLAEETRGAAGGDTAALAERQRDLSRRVGRISNDLQSFAEQLDDDQPQAATRLRRAAGHMSEGAVENEMRAAANEMETSRLGQAIDRQARIEETLSDTQSALRGEDRSRAEELAEALQQAGQELESIAGQQNAMTNALAGDAQPSKAEQAKQWQELAQRTEEVRSRMERLGVEEAAANMAQAQAEQSRGEELSKSGDREGAEDASRRAEEDLAAAQRELQQQSGELKDEGGRESLWAAVEKLEQVMAAQAVIVEKIRELREAGGKSSGNASATQEIAGAERKLADSVRQLQEELKAIAGFGYVLGAAGDDMEFAAAKLDRRDTSRITEARAADAVRRLATVTEVLVNLARENAGEESGQPKDEDEGDDREQQQQGAEGDEKAGLASLELLLRTQQWLLERTKAIESMEASSPEDAAFKRAQAEQLAEEQQGLHAEFIRIGQELSEGASR